jgi:hypothetical protein
VIELVYEYCPHFVGQSKTIGHEKRVSQAPVRRKGLHLTASEEQRLAGARESQNQRTWTVYSTPCLLAAMRSIGVE